MLNKKDGLVTQTKASLQEAFTCGLCLHFKQAPHSTNEKVCEQMGVRSFAIAPTCYTPDFTKIVGNTDEFLALISFFNNRSAQERKILLGMLRQQPTGKKLKMGTKLYIRISSRDYISNYLCGFVLGYTSGGDMVVTGSPDEQSRGRVFFAYLKFDTHVLTQKEWETHYIALHSQGLIQDPKNTGKRDITAKVIENDYEVPTIDSAPTEQSPKKPVNLRTTPIDQMMVY